MTSSSVSSFCALLDTGTNLASPVDDRLNGPVGGGGGGARVCAEPIAGLYPGIGGTRLALLLCVPGDVGDVGLGSAATFGEVGPSSRVGKLGGAAGLGVAPPVVVRNDRLVAACDNSSSDSDPALGDIVVVKGGGCGRAVHVNIWLMTSKERLTISGNRRWRWSSARSCRWLKVILAHRCFDSLDIPDEIGVIY